MPPPMAKSVSFIPLSPNSSRTMERHHRQHLAAEAEAEAPRRGDDGPDDERGSVAPRPISRHRRSSDPLSDRPVVRRRHHGDESDSDSDVEDLPERFDTQGRRLDGRNETGRPRMTTRRGEFERRPQRPGDWDVRGAWQVNGTDSERVERLVRDVTGVLEGRGSWIGLLGNVLGGGQQQVEDGDDEEHGRRRRRK